MAVSLYRAGSKIQIEKEKLSAASDTPRTHPSRENASRAWKKRKPICRWETSCADTRIHGTTKRQVAAMFAEEKPFLLPLPLEPFRYYQHGQRVVHLDGCVEVEAAYYGLPPGWIGRLVRVQWDELYVRILDPNNGRLLREHVRQKRGWYRIEKEDHPKHRPLRVSQLLWRVGRAGTHIGTLCNLIHNQLAEPGIRRVLGVLALAKKFGTAAVDEACAAALE
jgi:hypothetical protein